MATRPSINITKLLRGRLLQCTTQCRSLPAAAGGPKSEGVGGLSGGPKSEGVSGLSGGPESQGIGGLSGGKTGGFSDLTEGKNTP